MAMVVPPVTELVRRSRDVQDGTQERRPMFPTLVAVRNDRVVATLSSPRVGVTLTGATTMAVGLAPQALVLAAEGTVDGRPAITYSLMSSDLQAACAVQDVLDQDGQLTFGVPQQAGELDQTALRVLADALAQEPVDVSRVARQDRGGTFGERTFLPAEQGRVVVDAGTVKTLQDRVQGIAGRALYLARSQEAGRLALEAGLPRACLLQPQD
jgi:hypothetical protein